MSVVAPEPALIRSVISDESWTVDQLLAGVWTEAQAGRPFDPLTVEFCGALSRELMSSGSFPETVALGFWLRTAAIARLEADFRRTLGAAVMAVPRGIAFHVTPANVDTVFVYSWILSLLAGNRNIVRVSSRGSDAQARLLGCIRDTLADERFAGFRAVQRIITTDHDDETLRTISAVSDVRVVWGGDATVAHLSRFPLAFRGRDVTFPDRHSLAIIDVAAVLAADEPALAKVADRFFNDAYWFDQGACSSPRLVIWTQGEVSAERTSDARARFRDAVNDAVARRRYESQIGNVITRRAFALRSAALIEGVVIEAPTNEATWVLLPELDDYDRDNCGGGLFFEHVTADLRGALERMVTTRDQTAASYGLDGATVRALVEDLGGQGIDRWVPIGHALDFGAIWDGYDLLVELTRRVVVEV